MSSAQRSNSSRSPARRAPSGRSSCSSCSSLVGARSSHTCAARWLARLSLLNSLVILCTLAAQQLGSGPPPAAGQPNELTSGLEAGRGRAQLQRGARPPAPSHLIAGPRGSVGRPQLREEPAPGASDKTAPFYLSAGAPLASGLGSSAQELAAGNPFDDELVMAASDPNGSGSVSDDGGGGTAPQASDLQNKSQQQQQPPSQEDQYVTCPPDYEDQAYPNDLNLTLEEQRQLFAQADSLGLLNGTGLTGGHLELAAAAAAAAAGNASPSGANQVHLQQLNQLNLQHLQQQRALAANCYFPGKKMIEVITTIITPILFSLIVVVGLLGNIIVMIVILEERKMEKELTPTGILILDLSIADLSFIIFCIPFTGWDYAFGHWVFGAVWCKATQYLIVVCALSSIYTLVLMSIDRFMAIVYPIECLSYRTSTNTLYAIYIKWIVILLAAYPSVKMHGLIDQPNGQYKCRFLEDQYDSLTFQVIFFITSYLFPLVLIFCLYFALLNKLWYRTKPPGHKESHKMLESKKKVTWLVASIVVVFALCWCPIQVMLILMRIKSHNITATYVAVQVLAHTLGYMNSCVNPIVYAFASESFLNSFRRSSVGRYCCMLFCLAARNQPQRPHNQHQPHLHQQNNQSSALQQQQPALQQQQNSQRNQNSHLSVYEDPEQRSTNFGASYCESHEHPTMPDDGRSRNNGNSNANNSDSYFGSQQLLDGCQANRYQMIKSINSNCSIGRRLARNSGNDSNNISPNSTAFSAAIHAAAPNGFNNNTTSSGHSGSSYNNNNNNNNNETRTGNNHHGINNLPLEPRDRAQMRAAPKFCKTDRNIDYYTQINTGGSANVDKCNDSSDNQQKPDKEDGTATNAAPCNAPPGDTDPKEQPLVKQRLVAHLASPDNNQISHRCEPCYHEQKLN